MLLSLDNYSCCQGLEMTVVCLDFCLLFRLVFAYVVVCICLYCLYSVIHCLHWQLLMVRNALASACGLQCIGICLLSAMHWRVLMVCNALVSADDFTVNYVAEQTV